MSHCLCPQGVHCPGGYVSARIGTGNREPAQQDLQVGFKEETIGRGVLMAKETTCDVEAHRKP